MSIIYGVLQETYFAISKDTKDQLLPSRSENNCETEINHYGGSATQKHGLNSDLRRRLLHFRNHPAKFNIQLFWSMRPIFTVASRLRSFQVTTIRSLSRSIPTMSKPQYLSGDKAAIDAFVDKFDVSFLRSWKTN